MLAKYINSLYIFLLEHLKETIFSAFIINIFQLNSKNKQALQLNNLYFLL